MLSRRSLFALLAATALLRLAHLFAVRDAPFVGQLALDSQEYDRWARAIAAGDWLGSAPFFQAPLYPYLVAVVYRLVPLAAAAPLSVYLLQIAVAVLGCWALIRAAEALAGPRAAGATGLLFALYTPFWFYDVQLLKESFAVSAVCLLLFLLLKARASERPSVWFAVGLVGAFLALLRENMLLVAPFLLLLTWRERTGKGWLFALRRCGLLLLGLTLPLLVVASRNAALGGGFLPTTSQGGVNFWIGNNPSADGTYRPLVPGKQVPSYEREGARILAEQAVGRPLAADEVSGYWLRRALSWASAEPIAFVRLQFTKLGLYWSGYEWPDAVDYYWMKTISWPLRLPGLEWSAAALLALWGLLLERRRLALWSPVLLFELGWMLSVVAFFVFSRYRLPAVPGLLLLAAIPLARASEAFARGDRRQTGAMFAGVAILWLAPHLPGYPPRTELVHFNLGRLAEERGDLADAAAHYERTLAADPANFSATLNLGNLAARAGDYAAARSRFEAAVALSPDSDDAHANLGGALLALGERAAAERELARALELNPENRFARHNLEVLKARALQTVP
ncbi:MAG: tetratricopeptide repeat protein [Thermoanaerobaculia bacterium]|nr:tetratricopeptide repeat protein [Thermoanaerobaculia bacterium]MBP9825302.1 tetratricopeptide repeat protein [Thermoanaerobaculia bacterium]